MLISINPQNPQARLIRKIVEILQAGGIVVYPTDTYYGIGCDLLHPRAIARIYQLKRRDHSKPFSFICSDLTNISQYAKVSNYAYRTMKRLLPGPYTFILEGSKLVPKIMLTKRRTAGIRVPDNAICLALVQRARPPHHHHQRHDGRGRELSRRLPDPRPLRPAGGCRHRGRAGFGRALERRLPHRGHARGHPGRGGRRQPVRVEEETGFRVQGSGKEPGCCFSLLKP